MSHESGGCIMSDFDISYNFNQIQEYLDKDTSNVINEFTNTCNSSLIADPYMDSTPYLDAVEVTNDMDYVNNMNSVNKSYKRKLDTIVESAKKSCTQNPNDNLELNLAGSATTSISPDMNQLSMTDAEGDIQLVVNSIYEILQQDYSFAPSRIHKLNEKLIRKIKDHGASNVIIENVRTCSSLKDSIVGKSYTIIISCVIHQEYHNQLTF